MNDDQLLKAVKHVRKEWMRASLTGEGGMMRALLEGGGLPVREGVAVDIAGPTWSDKDSAIRYMLTTPPADVVKLLKTRGLV